MQIYDFINLAIEIRNKTQDINKINLSPVLPSRIRVDRGTETGVMATIHCYLRAQHGDLEDATESVLYGPSTENKIARWWRELLERMEAYFKSQLSTLLEDGLYDPQDEKDRCIKIISFGNLAQTYIRLIQS